MGFEGGQMPLYRRVPKRGFFHAGVKYEIVNVQQLNQLEDGATVNAALLKENGFIKKETGRIKILGDGELSKKLNVEVHRVSGSAQEKIEKAGGSVKIIEG
jgi:large subunit ribosomal protein L15